MVYFAALTGASTTEPRRASRLASTLSALLSRACLFLAR